MKTAIELFAGGGGAGLGLEAAGYTPVLAVEYDEQIAAVYDANRPSVVKVGRVQDVDPRPFAGVDLLWASPPCQAYSVARAKNLPDRDDADAGFDVLRWAAAVHPRMVCLENVRGYAKSPVFRAIVRGLEDMKYGVSWAIIDAANFGVPQNRVRLIMRAVLDGGCLLPPLPAPVSWVGWYAAVEDLIPTFPETQPAPWQVKRMPAGLLEGAPDSFMFTDDNTSRDRTARRSGEPSVSVCTRHTRKSPLRAFLLADADTGDHNAITRDAERPAFGITGHEASHQTRAFIVSGSNAGRNGPIYKEAAAPSFTVQANSCGHPDRAWLETGRWVALTVQGVARFQSFPDTYVYPVKADGSINKTLAGRVIGNAVPPLLAQRVAESLHA